MAKLCSVGCMNIVSLFTSGDAIDYLIKNTFTESAGARVGFPKVAIIITDGKSQDEVEIPARELRGIGVEVFSLGRSSSVIFILELFNT